ncbi:MAG: hypothetical protein AB1793_02140 [Candidatus Thermoplasmatota archaeon]
MSKNRCLGLVLSATVFSILSLVALSEGVAADAPGVYTSTVPDEGYFDSTYPADFTYDAELTLNPDGSGYLWLQCTDVVVHMDGWINPADVIGDSQTVDLDWGISGTSITITIYDNYGGVYNLPVTLDGNRIFGSGSYVDISYVTNSWEMDVIKTGGGTSTFGVPGIAGIAGAAAIGGFLVGFAVSLLPPPRDMGGSILPRNQTVLGTPYAPSQSVVVDHRLSSMADQRGGVTRPLPEVARMPMQFDPIQFPNVQMGAQTQVRPTDVHSTDTLSKRTCPSCGSTLIFTAAGWSCPGCNRAPPGG